MWRWLEGHLGISTVNEALEAIRPLIAVFARLGVSYRVGGSVASSWHGIGRSTMDIDLTANLELSQVESLVAGLQGAYYADAELIREALQGGQSFNLIHLETYFKLAVFPLQPRPYEQQSFSRVVVVQQINFVSAEDIVLKKLEWYRLSDGSERQWRDVIGVLKMQQGKLDMAYLQHWATEIGVSDLLEQVLEEGRA